MQEFVKFELKLHTARKIFKKAGYRSQVARSEHYISLTNRLKRIAFAKEHIHKTPEFWRAVIFSDEGIKGLKLVWRKPCTPLQKEHFVPTVKQVGDGVMASATFLDLGSSLSCQYDNDLKHTAEIIKLWLLYNVTNQLYTYPHSLDLNPIEHLWDLLERGISRHIISSKDMLKSVLKNEWEKIRVEETTRLVNSMPKRLQEVLKSRGYPTSY
ncbi:transposable element Tcb2 transposase [Trichonephila clavipes]|nr:transposable element Tcb2 transposase [Trichonephila clavipes]